MPLFDYLCLECGKINEMLVTSSAEDLQCSTCGSDNMRKMLSAVSSLSGTKKDSLPAAGDTACCGSSPGHAGCAGPGSCCGKA
jgi:putative FmdB family regulatory protein